MRVRYQKTHIPGSIPGRADMPSIFIFVCFIVAILSKPLEIRFVLLLPSLLLLRNEFAKPDRIRHVQFRHVGM